MCHPCLDQLNQSAVQDTANIPHSINRDQCLIEAAAVQVMTVHQQPMKTTTSILPDWFRIATRGILQCRFIDSI